MNIEDFDPGVMRDRVTLVSVSRSKDGLETETIADVATVWAHVYDESMKEVGIESVRAITQRKVRIRTRSDFQGGIQKIRHEGTVYNIIGTSIDRINRTTTYTISV